MRERIALDVSTLPLHGRGTASPTWWGTLAFMLIEGTGFALVIAMYFYLQSLATEWPPGTSAPDATAGTIVTIILLVSVVPNVFVSRWAQKGDLRKVRIGMIVMSILGVAPLVVRIFEFMSLNVRWDSNAYGSVVWTMLGLHTTHILTDLVDTLVLAALMFTRHGDNPRRFGDVQDNALYWNFVVITWLPLYGCLYWLPR
jgi:cytochrome c oxidase subunit III